MNYETYSLIFQEKFLFTVSYAKFMVIFLEQYGSAIFSEPG